MADQALVRTVEGYEAYIQNKGVDESVINAFCQASQVALAQDDKKYGLKVSSRAKKLIEWLTLNKTGGSIWDLEKYAQATGNEYDILNKYYDILRFESTEHFESFMLYMEKNRPYKERFYQPRINPLKQVADGIQALADDELDELFINLPARVGKTQIVKFAFLWCGSRNPESSNLYTAFSDKITGGFYDGLIELTTDPTYTYKDIFPQNVSKKIITDGKDYTIDLIRKKTYPTFTSRSIYGTLNGACDCNGLAVADDLFSGIEEAMSEDRQATVWGKFDNNFMKRLKRKAKLINMGTRWAVADVQGRRKDLLENDPEYRDRRWKAIIIPALNDKDESNFDYPYDLGYSTQDYKMMRSSFENNDDIESWFAQCQQEPIERFGALFNTSNMKFYNPKEDIPNEVPDRIFAAVDPAFGGGDFVAMPICYQYGETFYVVDVVYNDGDKTETRPEIVQKMENHLDKWERKTAEVHFEDTKTTSEYGDWCENEWKSDGYPVNVTRDPAPNSISKKDRIKNHAPDIRNLYFVDMRHRDKEYNKFFTEILKFKYDGKNKHDDATDSVAQLCDMIYGRTRVKKARVIKSPL